jgi:hypothetical protein
MADSDDEEETLLLFILLLRRRRRRVMVLSRNTWTKRWITRRQIQGAYANFITELNVEDPKKFRQFLRLERQHFKEILSIVSPVISNQFNRQSAQEKVFLSLSVFLQQVCSFV